eukprot:COSAG01_NODE_8415_length_2790_cov_28.153475_2_plen_45_part_00
MHDAMLYCVATAAACMADGAAALLMELLLLHGCDAAGCEEAGSH